MRSGVNRFSWYDRSGCLGKIAVAESESVISCYRVRRFAGIPPHSGRDRFRWNGRTSAKFLAFVRTVGTILLVRPSISLQQPLSEIGQSGERRPRVASEGAVFSLDSSIPFATVPILAMRETGQIRPDAARSFHQQTDACSPLFLLSVSKLVYRQTARGSSRDWSSIAPSSRIEPVVIRHGTVAPQFAVTDTSIVAAIASETGWFRDRLICTQLQKVITTYDDCTW